jgi:hypothetical protein
VLRVGLATVIATAVGLALSAGCFSCGYAPVYAARAEALHVKLVRAQVADVVAADEVASGVREELARAGALASGEAYPRVEIEVVRADEASEGVVAAPSGPAARATDVAVVARAWIATGEGAPPQAETGDMRAEETVAVDVAGGAAGAFGAAAGLDPRASAFHHADALRAAARRLGRALGARVLGRPAGSEEAGE